MPQKLKAIFFDVGNTLLFPNRAKILAPLYEREISPPPRLLRALECRTKIEFDAIVERGPADHGFWFLFYSHLMDELGIEGDGLRDLLVENTRISANWCDIRPGTKDILQRLGKQYRLGVISNADGQIASVLKHCGIADCFQTITDSGLFGCEKPRAEIFRLHCAKWMFAPRRASMSVTFIPSIISGRPARACRQYCSMWRVRTAIMG